MLCSIDVGRRLRSSTTAIPIALPITTINNQATYCLSESGDGADRVLLDGPIGTARPVLLLPDRDGFFQRVDREASGFEGGVAVRARDNDYHRRLRQVEVADAVQQRDPLGGRPAPPDLGDDLTHGAYGRLFVRLVGHRPDATSAVGMVPHDPEERNDGTRGGNGCPLLGGVGREGLGGELDPIANVSRRRKHGSQSTEHPWSGAW